MYLDSKLVAEELKSLRTKKNKTIEEVSNAVGIHFNTLSKYEKDASDLQLGLLEKILNYYGIDELIFFKVIREYNHKEV
jgi:transcriptional regulator with XRE-family HTH domain